ncbi:hypothetical protein ABH940_006806 [Streptacidiphilus sp. BW17]|uniref:hypothetical protein n=1 Tax=Streptacidiphilus sp. BW17 TaxID=3156274 RepID=UPI003512A571
MTQIQLEMDINTASSLDSSDILLNWAAGTSIGTGPGAGAGTEARTGADIDTGAGPESPRLLRLIGGPGSGKSRLLATLRRHSDTGPNGRTAQARVDASVPAAGQTAATVAWELGRQLGYGPLDPRELVARIADDAHPVTIVVPDLHRAGVGLLGGADVPSERVSAAAEIAAQVLAPLLELPHVRIAAETGTTGLLSDIADTLDIDLGFDPETGPEEATPPADEAAAPPLGPGSDWTAVDLHERDRALTTAAVEERGRLLADPGYLVHGSPVAVTAALADPETRAPGRLRRVWAAAAPAVTTPGIDAVERAALLHAAALGADKALATYLRPLAATHAWCARWSQPLDGAVALTAMAGGLALVDAEGQVRLFDADTGEQDDVIPADPDIRPGSLTAAAERLLIGTGSDGTVHILGPNAPSPAAVAVAARHNLRTLADEQARPLALDGGAGIPVAVACADGRVHLWPLDGAPMRPTTYQAHGLPITGVAVVQPSDGPLLVATGSLDGTVRLWDGHSVSVMQVPSARRGTLPSALAATDSASGPILAAAWSDQRICLWHLASGRVSVVPWLGPVKALACHMDGGVPTLSVATEATLTAITLQPLPW